MAANSKSSRSAGCPLRKSKLPILAAVFCVSLAITQSGAAQASEGVALKVDLVAWGDTIQGLSFKSEGAGNAITAESFAYSKPVNYRGPQIMEIFQLTTGSAGGEQTELPDAGGNAETPRPRPPAPVAKPAAPAGEATPAKTGLALELEKRRKDNPNLVALARIPGECSRATILLAPAADGTFQSYVIDDDPSKLPFGKLRIQNLSPLPIAINLPRETRPREIKPNQAITLEAPDGHIIYELAYKLDTEWKFQENNIIKVRPNEQTQMLILRSENQFFVSSDGSTGGFMQMVALRRGAESQ
jgi:hypothetical protein